MCVRLPWTEKLCAHKDTDSLNCQCITKWTSNGDYCFSSPIDDTSFDFYFYFYIFLYEIMISDPEMPLFHMERLLFLCICIYVYLYVCRLRYVLSPRFLETLVTVLM